jgi:hypothetical protein
MTRGGKREGAGRPKEAPTVSMSFRFTLQEREALRRRAQAAGLSVSEYVKLNTIGGKEVDRSETQCLSVTAAGKQ